MSDDNETCVIAKGPLATGTVDTVDDIEPDFIRFVRHTALRLDRTFPQSGQRDGGQKGHFIEDDGEPTFFTQVEEFDTSGRGIRILRYVRESGTEGQRDGNIIVSAIGLANDATLSLRWNFISTAEEVRGTSAALFVSGAGKEGCIDDFRDVFDVLTS